MLAAAETQLRLAGTVSLDSAARAAGVTKPGLMYHFGTKQDLMTALLDRMMTRHEEALARRLARLAGTRDPLQATVQHRLAAYVTWVCTAEFDGADLVMFADPRLRDTLTAAWIERLRPWLAVPANLSGDRQARLLSARLLADGVWLAGAGGSLSMTRSQKRSVKQVALELIAGEQ